MNTGGTGIFNCKECHKTESLWNHTTTGHKEGEQLEDRRSVGASNCNSGDGTDQRAQSLMFMMIVLLIPKNVNTLKKSIAAVLFTPKITRRISWRQSPPSFVRIRRPTAWVMRQPSTGMYHLVLLYMCTHNPMWLYINKRSKLMSESIVLKCLKRPEEIY